SSICQKARMSVGLFTSPHLSDIRERIQIDGEMISEESFAEAFFRTREAAEALAEEGLSHPSFFEFLYLMACCYFAEEKPDIVLVETGLGGRLDATNTLERPLATVITSVSLDHMQYLGTTVSEIAAEKAGILKNGVPAIAWCGNPEAAAVIERRALEVGAPLFRVAREDIENTQGQFLCVPKNGELFLNRASGIDFFVRSGYDSRQIRLRVPGAALFQTENAALAVRAAEVLRQETELFAAYSENDRFDALLREGVGRMRWPCRMEEILPDVFLDGAHNEDGIQRFSESIERVLEGEVNRRRFVLLFGAVNDKDYGSMIKRLAALKPAFVLATEVPGGRKADAEEFALAFAENGVKNIKVIKEAQAAFAEALKEKQDGVVGICGSLYLAGAIREVNHDQLRGRTEKV
ncbi:MAG: bifunctional folylpolyglutamate synthase/dihydrofolate synthase, partial [Lachnospiraceae bacterium]